MDHRADLQAKGNGTSMSAFGDRLRREREMRGITLDEIAESTKIARRHLEALESENFNQLPGGVFNKGFVRAYARFLGTDEDQAVADYSAANHEKPEPEDKFPLEIHAKPDRELNPRRSYLPMAFGVAALVGVLVGYFLWARSKPHIADPRPVQAAIPSQPTALNSAPQPSTSGESAQASTATPTPAAPKNEKRFFVLVKAKEDSWVSIVADGKSVMESVLNADKQKKIKAGQTVILRTGNAGGIEVSFNGRPLGALGNENEPRTLTFNAAGLVQ